MMTDQHVRASLPQELFEGLREALDQGSSASKRLLRMVLDATKESLTCQAAVVLTPADDHNLRFYQATDDRFLTDSIPVVPIASSIAGFVFLSGQTIALDSARKSSMHFAEVDEKVGFVTAEYVAVPIIHEGATAGVLTAANRSAGGREGPFTQDEIEVAGLYADLCALLLSYESSLRRQIAATDEEVHRLFAESASEQDLDSGLMFASSMERGTDQLRAQVNLALRDLSHADLELIHDLAARLAEAPSDDNV